MMAVAQAYQNQGVGARLKWAQRERAIAEGRQFIKWTWDPMQARNAHFNLNRLGVVVEKYADNFYGVDYNADPQLPLEERPGLQSDRLFGHWYLTSSRVVSLSRGEPGPDPGKPAASLAIPTEWSTDLPKFQIGSARNHWFADLNFVNELNVKLYIDEYV